MVLQYSCPECSFECNSRNCLINHRFTHECSACPIGKFDNSSKECVKCYKLIKTRLEKDDTTQRK